MSQAPSYRLRHGAGNFAGLVFIVTLFLLGGIAHLVFTSLFTEVVPAYLPWPRLIVILTGFCELAGAMGLLYRPLRRAAGAALALYTVCVTPVHIDMLMHAARWAIVGLPLLWVRLLLQPVLVWLILKVSYFRS